jgi:CBS domain-containing protein
MICPSCGTENINGSDRCENCLSPFRDLDIPGPDTAEGLARHVMEDRLSELEKETPIVVAPDTPAIDVTTRMKELNAGCALVLDGPKLVGIFTEHDVLRRMCASLSTRGSSPTPGSPAGQPGWGGTVREGVSRRQPDAHDEAAPVIPVDGIPLTDAPFNDIPLEEIRVEELFVKETMVEVEVARYEAKEDSNDLAIGSALQVPVKKLMSPDPETLHEHESVAYALNKMSLGRYRHIPVEKADGTYTVASIKSVLKYIAQEDW